MAPVSAVAQSATAPDRMQETYRDWILRCEAPEMPDETPAAQSCEIVQELFQTETNQRLLSVTLQAADGGAEMLLVTPFGLRLADGVTIAVDEETLAQVAFFTCLPQGCIATGELDADMLARLAPSETAEILMAGQGGGEVSISVSLNGFAAAWDRLAELRGE